MEIEQNIIGTDQGQAEQAGVLKDASRGQRFVSFLIDALIMTVVGSVVSKIFFTIGMHQSKATYSLLYLVVFSLQVYLMYIRSQSIGKYLLNIQVVNAETGERADFWSYLILREIIGKTLLLGLIPVWNFFFMPFYFLIDSLFIFRDDSRTMHDLIGGTKVVNMKKEHRWKSILDLEKL